MAWGARSLISTQVQKRRLTGRSGRRRRDVAPLETDATAGLFGAYFGNAQSPIQGEGFADETPAERRRRRRRQRRETGDDGRPPRDQARGQAQGPAVAAGTSSRLSVLMHVRGPRRDGEAHLLLRLCNLYILCESVRCFSVVRGRGY